MGTNPGHDGPGEWIRRPVTVAKGYHPQHRIHGGGFDLLELVVAGAKGGLDDPDQGLEVVGEQMVRPAGLKMLLVVATLQVEAAIGKQGEPGDGLVVGGVHGCNAVGKVMMQIRRRLRILAGASKE
jgi:hypothetical protein